MRKLVKVTGKISRSVLFIVHKSSLTEIGLASSDAEGTGIRFPWKHTPVIDSDFVDSNRTKDT